MHRQKRADWTLYKSIIIHGGDIIIVRLKKDEKSYNRIQKVWNMKDGYKKYVALNVLMLDAEYLTPLWCKLNDEARRLQDLGYDCEQ